MHVCCMYNLYDSRGLCDKFDTLSTLKFISLTYILEQCKGLYTYMNVHMQVHIAEYRIAFHDHCKRMYVRTNCKVIK